MINIYRQPIKSTALAWRPGTTDLILTISDICPIFIGHSYTLKIIESATVEALSVPIMGDYRERVVDVPLRRRSLHATVTISSKQELPLPLGICLQVRHKASATLVCAVKVSLDTTNPGSATARLNAALANEKFAAIYGQVRPR